MSAKGTPLIVEAPATAEAIAQQLTRRIDEILRAGKPDPLREALVCVGARFGEILVQHLNAAPDRLRGYFDSRLGGLAAAALPAEVWLSFQPVATRPVTAASVTVPAHTMAAASPAAGDSEAVVFETLSDLELARLQADLAFVVDPLRDAVADASALLSAEGCQTDLLAAAQPVDRVLHIALPDALSRAPLSALKVELEVVDAGVRPSQSRLDWGICTEQGFVPLAVQGDSTLQFARSGDVVLTPPANWPALAQHGLQARWLACRLRAGAAADTQGLPLKPPRLTRLRLAATAQTRGLKPSLLCFGAAVLDASKDFFPFGERPRFGDLFHLNADSILLPQARVTIGLELTNPAQRDNGPLPAVQPEGQPRVVWEIFTQRGWVALAATDATQSMTQSGEISFVVPDDVAVHGIAGRTGGWIRARLAGGNFGMLQLAPGISQPIAPSIATLVIGADLEIAPLAPTCMVRLGPLDAQRVDTAASPAFAAFSPQETAGQALYLGLASREADLQGRKLALLVDLQPAPGKPIWSDLQQAGPAAQPRWQLLGSEGWRDCEVIDQTAALTRTGVVELRLPTTPSAWTGMRLDTEPPLACWLRVEWPASQSVLRLRQLALNTVRARQTLKLDNELLGSGTSRPNQQFAALRKPVFGEVVLQVREASDGADDGPWLRWDRVTDFSASASNSHHFTLDQITGRITFGDGRNGRIPPAGPNNVRLHRYHAGGGRQGNRPAGTVTQLRSAIPYVESVINRVAATGGQDETVAVSGAGAWLRHRGRAVCAADYEDLARSASREVALAFCHGSGDAASAGVVELIIVPQSEEARPQPNLELLATVKAFLDSRRPPWVRLVLSGPDYAAACVRARVRCATGASPLATAAACRLRLLAFLHPLSGGVAGQGWQPGLRPHRSDLLALLAEVDDVDRVESIELRIDPPPGANSADALICTGQLEVVA